MEEKKNCVAMVLPVTLSVEMVANELTVNVLTMDEVPVCVSKLRFVVERVDT